MSKLSQAAAVAAAHIVARLDADFRLLRMIQDATGELSEGDAPSVQHAAEAIQAGAVRAIGELLEIHREAARLSGWAEGGAL